MADTERTQSGWRGRFVVALRLLVLLTTALPTQAAAGGGPTQLELSGLSQMSEEVVREAVGELPPADDIDREWINGAVRRIIILYRNHGYTQARGWSYSGGDGRIRIHVDEGVMARVVFTGVGAYRGLIYRIDLNLPGDVFNGPVLDDALAGLRAKHGLANISHEVVETEYRVEMPLGHLAALRELRITVVTQESYGWGFDLSLDATWGPILRGRYSDSDLIWDDDRLETSLHVAIPYRSFVLSSDPRLTWVHGALYLGYRLPAFVSGRLAPEIDSETSLSQFSRRDLALERAFVFRQSALVSLALLFLPLWEAHVGFGPDYRRVFDVLQTLPDPSGVSEVSNDRVVSAEGLLRYKVSLAAALHLTPGELREDLRGELALEFSYSFTQFGEHLGRADASGQGVWRFGPHVLILRGRSFLRFGDVRFFDESSLAGSYLRAFFGNRYWVREAAQAELAFRLAVFKDFIHLGLFNNVAVFGDRSAGGNRFAAADAFGPSLHFLMFDRFALDLYYGFGFAFDPPVFSHNISFEVKTVF